LAFSFFLSFSLSFSFLSFISLFLDEYSYPDDIMTLDFGQDMFEHTIRGFKGDMNKLVSQGLGRPIS